MAPHLTRRIAIPFVLALTLVSCGGGSAPLRSPARAPTSVTRDGSGKDVTINNQPDAVGSTFDATPARTYAVLLKVYEELGIEPKERDPSTGIVGNLRFITSRRIQGTPMSTYLDCGMGPGGVTANVSRIEMSIRSQVSAVSGGSQIETVMMATARNMEGTSNNGVQCASTLRLEQEILKRVKIQLLK